MRWGRHFCQWLSFWGMEKLTHACWSTDVYENMCWSLGESKWASTQSGAWQKELMPACESSCQKHKTYKDSLLKRQITTWIHAVGPGQWKEKANWKQSKYIYFQLVWFHLVALVCFVFFALVMVSADKQLLNHTQQREDVPDVGVVSATPQLLRGLAGDGVLYLATCDQWRCHRWTPDQTDGVTLREEVDWILRPQMLTDTMEWFFFFLVTMEGYNGLQPPALWSIRAFSYWLSAPTLTPALFCVSLVPISSYKCVFCWFSFWFPPNFHLSHSLHFCLVWFGLCLFYVWSNEFSVLKLSLSPLPVLSFDLMEFVFILRVYCY